MLTNSTADPITSQTGIATAATNAAFSHDLGSRTVFQSAGITGSAGNSALTDGVSGIAHAKDTVNTLLTFNFIVPTDLTVTLLDIHSTLNSSRDLPWNSENQTGEFVGFLPGLGGGGTAFGVKLDGTFFGIPGFNPGSSTTFLALTGVHTIDIQITADESAAAKYPYVVPEPSTLALLSVGILAIPLMRRKSVMGK